jgi:hypothetical protein
MIWAISGAAIVTPLLMWLAARSKSWLLKAFHAVAMLCAVTASIIAAQAIADILMKNTVMMTEVHKIFYNPLFLGSGAYLGLFGLYRGWARLFERV